MKGKKTAAPEITDLADQIGEFVEYWGFKRVHGRIWTHLLLSQNPLDASELIRRLGISKALISMSLSDLLKYEVIEEAGKSERGTLLYRANPDVVGVILNVLRVRERRMLSRISAAHGLLKDLPVSELRANDIDCEKMKHLGKLIGIASKALEAFILGCRFDISGARSLNFPTVSEP